MTMNKRFLGPIWPGCGPDWAEPVEELTVGQELPGMGGATHGPAAGWTPEEAAEVEKLLAGVLGEGWAERARIKREAEAKRKRRVIVPTTLRGEFDGVESCLDRIAKQLEVVATENVSELQAVIEACEARITKCEQAQERLDRAARPSVIPMGEDDG